MKNMKLRFVWSVNDSIVVSYCSHQILFLIQISHIYIYIYIYQSKTTWKISFNEKTSIINQICYLCTISFKRSWLCCNKIIIMKRNKLRNANHHNWQPFLLRKWQLQSLRTSEDSYDIERFMDLSVEVWMVYKQRALPLI